MAWVKIDDHFDDHPKVVAAGPLGMALYVAGLCYANRNDTKGRIPEGQVARLISLEGFRSSSRSVAAKLVEVGLWEKVEGGFLIHDYHEYQLTSAIAKARSEAGKKGALARWGDGKPDGNSHSNSDSKSMPRIPLPESRSPGDLETSQTALAKRLNAVCKRPDPIDALLIVEALAKHIDLKLIDECVGWAEERDEDARPSSPRYFLKTAADWARKRGVTVPNLQPEGLLS